MRRTISVVLGLITVMALLALALAMPVAARWGDLPAWEQTSSTDQITTEQAKATAEGWLGDNGPMTVMMADMPQGDMMDCGMDRGMLNGEHQHSQHGSMSAMMMGSGGMADMMDPTACQTMRDVPAAKLLAEPQTVDQAADAAQAWLDVNQAGATATGAMSFPG